MRTMKGFVLGVILMVGAVPAHAAQNWSLGFSYGATEIDEFCDAADEAFALLSASTTSCDDTDNGFKIRLGQDFTEHFRLETFYADFGEAEARSDFDDRATGEASGFGIAGMVMAPVADRVDLFAKLGILFWDVEVEVDAPGIGSGRDTDNGSDVFYGLGTRLWASDRVSLRAEWEQFTLDDADLEMISVGVDIHF